MQLLYPPVVQYLSEGTIMLVEIANDKFIEANDILSCVYEATLNRAKLKAVKKCFCGPIHSQTEYDSLITKINLAKK